MKRVILFTFGIIFNLSLFAQSVNWQWVQNMGSYNNDRCFGLASDTNGNIYTTQIYNRALSAQEVLQNYNATKTRFGL